MIEIDKGSSAIEDDVLDEVAKTVSRAVALQIGEEAEVALILVGEEEIQRLNRDFRDKDAVTDVLSFPANELHGPLLQADIQSGMVEKNEDGLSVLGDIAICVPRTEAQAKEIGNTFLEELKFLSVHGVLHLLGYDHIDKEEEEVMKLFQKKVLLRTNEGQE